MRQGSGEAGGQEMRVAQRCGTCGQVQVSRWATAGEATCRCSVRLFCAECKSSKEKMIPWRPEEKDPLLSILLAVKVGCWGELPKTCTTNKSGLSLARDRGSVCLYKHLCYSRLVS